MTEVENIATQATAEEGIGEITSEEELAAILTPDQETGEGIETEQKVDENGLPVLIDEEKPAGEETKPGEETGKEPETEEEFANMVEYINNRYELNLNTGELPSEMTRAQEAEIVGNLYDKVVQSANDKINDYQGIEETLKDKEVARFIAAKRDGKTMQDFVLEYAGSSAGKSDEELVKDKLKNQFPNMSDDDIQDSLDKLGDEKVTAMAKEARIKDAADEEVREKERVEKEKLQSEQDVESRTEEVRGYKSYVGKINNVNGIPIDDKMKRELIAAATQPDKDGVTYLERALQSDLGIVRATLGLLHLERLMDAGKTTKKNQIRNDLMERLTANPEELQSRTTVETEDGFDEKAANSF